MRIWAIALVMVVAIAAPRAGEGQRVARPVRADASRRGTERDPMDTVLHPSALVRLIDEIGGRRVVLPRARVVAVINPRAFLIESAAALPALTGHIDRVLVLVDAGALRVDPDALVDENVRVLGTARTLLGVQTTAEVPWPRELTKDVLKRYEIRAAVLARSVQTADGVELTDRR